MASHLHLLLLLLISTLPFTTSESTSCLMVYKQGGAPAVFQSPKCPRWKLSSEYEFGTPRSSRCQTAVRQGRRMYQEDRTFCVLDLRVPFPGATGVTEAVVGIVAIFDGHNGSEASDMASKLLMEYLSLHTYFLLDVTFSSILERFRLRMLKHEDKHFSLPLHEDREYEHHFFDQERLKHTWPEIFDELFRLEILKESLLRTVADIDATFSREAYMYNLDSGSTATIALIVDGQILVANVGDSKTLLCSERYQSPEEAKATLLRLYRQKRADGTLSRSKGFNNWKDVTSNASAYLFARELTRDHRPDREDEKSRVERSGGYVSDWAGVPRVNGQLAVSRSIGDVSLKRYGVTASPEVSEWQPLAVNDSYLIAASDGIFEKMSPQDVCDLLSEVQNNDSMRLELSSGCSNSLADCIVNTAFERGSMDNMGAVVVPLRPMVFKDSSFNQLLVRVGDFDRLSPGSSNLMSQLAVEVPPVLALPEQTYPIHPKFDRLLVEEKHGRLGYFYLAENLKRNEEQMIGILEDEDEEDANKLRSPSLPGIDVDHFSGALHLYNDLNFCFDFGLASDGNTDQCMYQEGLTSFLALLQSIPLLDTGPDLEPSDRITPEMGYILKKRFGRGAYGEVWLAFHWNCSPHIITSKGEFTNRSSSSCHLKFDSREESEDSSGQHDFLGDSQYNTLFILKRIMVEKGSSVYLSGSREKYFGEMFLDASMSLNELLTSGIQSTFDDELTSDWDDLEEMNNASEETPDGETLKELVHEEGLHHIARYVESFESRANEIWLVFRHEGISLSKLMYTAEEIEGHDQTERGRYAPLLRPSEWWHWLKTTDAGQKQMRNLIWQLLMAVKACYDRSVTHRDIKPENMVICIEDQESGRCLKSIDQDSKHVTHMRIIDFGSAMDEFSLKHLYGSRGPSRAEQTYEYTPPEALLNNSWYKGPTSRILKYDMWSVGVVMLELILGSPDVFQISTLSRALLDKHVGGWNEDLRDLAYRLRSFMDMCILVSGHTNRTNRQDKISPASWKCSEEFFSNLIKTRDPLKIGFPNVWAMRLVRQLLSWDPDDRLSVDDALQHPYFLPLKP
ncbi:hypothetical protein Droror1_Dr00008416 [Drosera rotundifolia]